MNLLLPNAFFKFQIESMIGLDTNKISIDISESKIPLSLQPNYVEIYQGGNSLHNATIDFDYKTGMALIDLTPSAKDKFDDIFKSAAKYLPFTFSFKTSSREGPNISKYHFYVIGND